MVDPALFQRTSPLRLAYLTKADWVSVPFGHMMVVNVMLPYYDIVITCVDIHVCPKKSLVSRGFLNGPDSVQTLGYGTPAMMVNVAKVLRARPA
jgi:hypothetical protein